MIVFETGSEPSSRAAEEEVGGRRISGRLLPYGLNGDSIRRRFDPVTRRFATTRARGETAVNAGPANPDAWGAAVSRLPAGPVLVGPGSVGEAVRGAYRAAAEGAIRAGRPVFLLDPCPQGLPQSGGGWVVLSTFDPVGDPGNGNSIAFPALAAARACGARCGVLFPLIPGWTAEADSLEALLSEAAAGGALSATPLVPETDGESRRAIVEAHSEASAEASEDFFERIHHQDWAPRMVELLAHVRRRCAAHGLSAMPPRAVGLHEPTGNAAASARLEERAELEHLPEHRTASLRAAVRWIDESGRDLAAVALEGNFRRVFPFDSDLAAVAEEALRGSSVR